VVGLFSGVLAGTGFGPEGKLGLGEAVTVGLLGMTEGLTEDMTGALPEPITFFAMILSSLKK
jgi:hypothetical protein